MKPGSWAGGLDCLGKSDYFLGSNKLFPQFLIDEKGALDYTRRKLNIKAFDLECRHILEIL